MTYWSLLQLNDKAWLWSECFMQFWKRSLRYIFLHNLWISEKMFSFKHNTGRFTIYDRFTLCSLYNLHSNCTHVITMNKGLKTVPSPSLQHSLVLLTCSTSRHFIHQAGQPFALARSHFPPLHASCLLPFTLPNRVNVKTAEGWDGQEHTSTKPLKTVLGKHWNLIAIPSSVALIAAPLS